jgi:hypothetical protein
MARPASSAEAAVLEAVVLEDTDQARELLTDFLPGELRRFITRCRDAIVLAQHEHARRHAG